MTTPPPAPEMSYYQRYVHYFGILPTRNIQDTVRELMCQADAYVWGFQDAGGKVNDPEHSQDFKYAYAIVVARYHARESRTWPPIQDAWTSWQEYDTIKDHGGNDLLA